MEKNVFLVLLTILSVVRPQQVVVNNVQADRGLGGRQWGLIRLPPIFMYDDLTQCEAHDSVYCYARTILRVDRFPHGYVLPDTESTSRIVYNHRAQFLDLGICLSSCEEELRHLSTSEKAALYHSKINVNFTSLIPNELFPTMENDKSKYETLVNICVNRRLSVEYNMSGYTALEYCRPRPIEVARSFDFLEILFIAVSAGFIGALLISTMLDACSVRPESSVVSAFSIRKNWNRLMGEQRSSLHLDLLYIDGLRVVVNHLVIVLHTFLVAGVVPTKNYQDLEDLLGYRGLQAYVSCNAFLVQIFFTIGGYLLTVNFLRDASRAPINAKYIVNKLLNRLVRLMPVYGYFLLFSVSLNRRFDVNENGFRLFTAENAICRQNWWSNLLFVNNFSWPRELCLMHTWYLAADLQLFLMALAVLLVIYRWPRVAGFLFVSGVILSFWVPAYITHQQKLHPVLPSKLSEAKFLVMYEPWLRHLYLPSYANTGCYLFGIIAGYLYHQTTTNNLQLGKSPVYRLADKMVTPVLLMVIVSSCLWYNFDVPKPSVWVSMYSALFRNIIGIFVALCFLRCINTPKGLLRSILSSKPFVTLGKLTYSVYILHDVVMRFVLLQERIGTMLSVSKFLGYIYFVNGASFVGGLIVFMAIEQPMIQLLKPVVNRAYPIQVDKSKNN
ncbi:nose resistant to fluoxetine protein 6-like [Anopheles ziemanni]|uniref:nose resistant to fluoxetine protein 6-like n=1 Tax=Anopheles coustani TaxID=139045 RepID=UPI002657F2E8|nr:nose resistant to fluoxetine protein 6-like [Anopheles coustani]XP_058178687.1 nose resistant to fluoxetine protein 6-like [Anopheles ziemanni]